MFVKLNNNLIDVYPYSYHQLRADNSNTSFPDAISDERLAEWSVFPVVLQTQPLTSPSMIAEEVAPIQINGVWTQQWNIRTLTEQELQVLANNIKSKRDALLQESDWTQLPDVLIDKQPWVIYRQSLRDLSLQTNFPTIVIWPIKPE